MRTYYLFEIEADEKPIFSKDEYENIENLTNKIAESENKEIVAYGEIEQNKYISLYEKSNF